MKRKGLAIIAGIVVLLFVAVLAIPALVDVNRYRPRIEAKLEEQLGRKVSLGQMRLRLLPLSFRVQKAMIAEADEFHTGRPFAEADTLDIRPKLLPLLHKNLEISSLSLTDPRIEFVRNASGTWNFATLSAHKKDDGRPVSINELRIQNGQVAVTDLQQHQQRSVYDHIDLLLNDYSPHSAFSIQAQAHMPGAGEQTIALNGQAGPLRTDDIALSPFNGRFDFTEVSLAGLQRFLNLQQLQNSDGVITGRIDASNRDGNFASNGKLQARNVRLRGVDLGYPVAADYNVSGNLNDKTTQIHKGEVRLGSTPIALSGTLNGKQNPSTIDLNVKTSDAPIAELARLASAFGVAFDAENQASGKVTLNVQASGAANKPALSGDIAAHDVRISGGRLRAPVDLKDIKLVLSPDAIRSNSFTASTGGTSLTGQFTLSQYTTAAPQLEAAANTGNAQIGELLNIAKAYGVSSLKSADGSGIVRLNFTMKGPVENPESFNYSGTGGIENATLNMPSFPKPLSVRHADVHFNGNSVNLDNVDFSMGETVAHGNLKATNLAAPTVEFSLAANKLNVMEWRGLTQHVKQQQSQPQPQRQSAPSDTFISRVNGSGRVTIDTVIYDKVTLTNVNAPVRLDHGVITLNPVTANLYGGQQVAQVVLDTRTQPATYTVDGKLQHIDANQFLSSISPLDNALYGVLSANADTRFVSDGNAKNIAQSLRGKASINLTNGAIGNMDLLHQVGTIAKFLQMKGPVEPSTKVSQLTGDFDIADGIARTNNLSAVIEGGSLAANGLVNLVQQTLNMHVTAVLSKDYSQFVGGTGIGGFMTTALGNKNGEIVVPMIVTGSLRSPQFTPDVQAVAKMKLNGDFATGILNEFLGRAKPGASPGQPPAQQQPQDAVPNILDKLFGGQKK